MPTYPELSGKIAVISGASGNLGAAVAHRLYKEQVKLAVIDRHQDRINETLRKLDIDPKSVLIGLVDLTKKAEVDSFIDQVTATFGQVDMMINTAGGYKPGKLVSETDEDFWDSVIELNSKPALHLSAAVARCMTAKGNKGRIINVAGKAGLSAFATGAAYGAGKAIVLRLTESMSAELLKRGITVNAVLPSTIDTPQNRANEPNADFSKWVQPESIADVIAFLCSDSARDISGAAIPVYGRA